MSTGIMSPQMEWDNILYQFKKQHMTPQQFAALPPLTMPMEKKAVGSPVANRHRSTSCGSSSPMSIASPMSSPSKLSPSQQLFAVNETYQQQSQVAHNNLFNSLQQQVAASQRKLDRSLSEPVGTDSRLNGKNTNINTSRYKTEMCRPFEENGHCKYGDKCQFAHGEHELRNLNRHPKYKTELCRTFHTVGFCPYGPRCHFIHSEDEHKLNYIIQQKQKQAVHQAAQQVVQLQQLQQAAQQVSSQHSQQASSAQRALNLGGTPRDLLHSLGSTADSPPASMPDTPQSMSPTFGMSDLEVFSPLSSLSSSSSSSCSSRSYQQQQHQHYHQHHLGSTALTPPPQAPTFTFPIQEFSSALASHVTTSPTPVMCPLNVQTQVDPIASLAAGLQAALININASSKPSTSPTSSCDSIGAPFTDMYSHPSPPDSINGDDLFAQSFRLPIFSQIAED